MKVWITEYALSRGIIEAEGGFMEKDEAEMLKGMPKPKRICVRYENQPKRFFVKPHWHMNSWDAACRAVDMREARIKSLELQIARLKTLKFN